MADVPLLILFLVAVGLALIFIEVFLLPGFGVVGGLGFISAGLACVLTYERYGAVPGLVMCLGVTAVALLAVVTLARSRTGRTMVLGKALAKGSGADEKSVGTGPELGARGTTLTPLRPSGIAMFGTLRCDVIAEGEFVEAGRPIRVCELSGGRVVVEVDGESS